MKMSKNNTLLEIKTKDISEQKGFNTRYDLGDLREIVNNMSRNGFDPSQPLIVRPDPEKEGKYLLGAQGHRRLASANEAGLTTVFAVLESEDLSDTDRNLDIVRLNSGEPLPQLAVARVVVRALLDPDMTQAEVAKLLSKSPTYVGNCIKLSKTTKQTQKFIESGKISAESVVEIINDLKAKDEKGFEKVEARVEQLIEKAGDKKVTKKTKDKAEDEEEETKEEREEREAKEKEEEEAKEQQKARLKEWKQVVSRVTKFQELVVSQVDAFNAYERENKDDKHSPFQVATLDLFVAMASYLNNQGTDTARAFDATIEGGKLSDVNAALRGIEKAHREEVKGQVKEVKEEAKEQVKAIKEEAKESKEEAAKRVKAAKAAIAKV